MDGVNVSVPVSEKMAERLAQVEREGDVGDYVRRLIVADMKLGGKYREPTKRVLSTDYRDTDNRVLRYRPHR